MLPQHHRTGSTRTLITIQKTDIVRGLLVVNTVRLNRYTTDPHSLLRQFCRVTAAMETPPRSCDATSTEVARSTPMQHAASSPSGYAGVPYHFRPSLGVDHWPPDSGLYPPPRPPPPPPLPPAPPRGQAETSALPASSARLRPPPPPPRDQDCPSLPPPLPPLEGTLGELASGLASAAKRAFPSDGFAAATMAAAEAAISAMAAALVSGTDPPRLNRSPLGLSPLSRSPRPPLPLAPSRPQPASPPPLPRRGPSPPSVPPRRPLPPPPSRDHDCS